MELMLVSMWEFVKESAEAAKQRTRDLQIEQINYIPERDEARLEVNRWHRIDQAVAAFADMRGSTLLSTSKHASTMAKMYELFTGGWIQVLRAMNVDFVDIKGDGGFGLFYGKAGVVQALLAAVTFRTLVRDYLQPYAAGLTDGEAIDWQLEAKVGVHKGPLLVKKIGHRDSSDQQNNWLVWAGKPVNYSSKLSSLAGPGELLITHPVFVDLQAPDVLRDHLVHSCGCPGGTPTDLWEELETDSNEVQAVGETRVYKLTSTWCSTHGDEYFDELRNYLEHKGITISVPTPSA